MIELRKYQQEAVDAAIDFFKNGKTKDRPIIVAPTASGKSILAATISHRLQDDGLIVLQPSLELLEQNYNKFKLYGGEASLYSASAGKKEVGQVTFATIGSVVNVAHLFAHVKYALIDECHLVPPRDGKKKAKASMYMKFLGDLPHIKVTGMTATAFRMKKYRDRFTSEPYSQINLLPRERPHFFNTFLHVTQIGDLYDQKYLCPIKYIPLHWENGQLRYNTTGADFSDDSMEDELKRQRVHERIPELVAQSIRKGRKHRLVFVKNVYDADRLASQVPESAFVCATTKPIERARIIEEFKSGKIKTVFNVGVLTTGFDFPALDTIIMARPTLSMDLYMQMVGRGTRLSPGKEDCALVDMVGNIERFGPIEKIRYEKDEKEGWILHNGERQLSGVRM